MFKNIEQSESGQKIDERAILVRQIKIPYRHDDPDNPLKELSELTLSAGAVICDQMIAVRSKPIAATFIGKGKAEELAELVKFHQATLIIFDHTISPIQERNIERIVECRVLDRSGLILDIFAQRATSSEGKLQVELAQLKHLSTRLVRGWTHLERQKGGIGLRGPGESQLETDRRLIGRRIKTLSQRLKRVEAQRNLRRRSRHRTPVPTISLVGYTNAGKSSLFNTITGSNVLVEDKLFATLDPTMRRVELPGYGAVVLSDTVGFVKDLPHTLVAAFHSTLEEVTSATCLLLVNDYSDPEYQELRCHVEQVLEEIGAQDIPVIQVNNKIDITGDGARAQSTGDQGVNRVWVSAQTGAGIDLLLSAISEYLSREHQYYFLRLKPGAGKLRSKLFQRCEIISEQVDEVGDITMEVKMEAATRGWLESQHQFNGLWNEIQDETANLVGRTAKSVTG